MGASSLDSCLDMCIEALVTDDTKKGGPHETLLKELLNFSKSIAVKIVGKNTKEIEKVMLRIFGTIRIILV